MITRRQVFGFFGFFGFFGLLLIPSSWRMFAQSKSAQQEAARQMMKTAEQNGIRSYFAEDRHRFEYLNKHMVVIWRHDLKKQFTLNLDTHEYTIGAIPQRTARLLISVTKAGDKPEPTQSFEILPFDPTLFEIPASFSKK